MIKSAGSTSGERGDTWHPTVKQEYNSFRKKTQHCSELPKGAGIDKEGVFERLIEALAFILGLDERRFRKEDNLRKKCFSFNIKWAFRDQTEKYKKQNRLKKDESNEQ